jgi:uncharacterized protein (DUF58 family)
MIKNPQTRRRASLTLLILGAILFLLVPQNAWIGLVFAGLGLLLEALGVAIGHSSES